MTTGNYAPLNETTSDDLPRTLRRERDRLAREKQAADLLSEQAEWDRTNRAASAVATTGSYGTPEAAHPYDQAYVAQDDTGRVPATVTRIKVPFFSLMGFFIKAVFAAVPALLILIGMLYALGVILQMYFPQLIKMKILISFPG
jgi:hypothetical protein